MTQYVLDNAWQQARERLAALEAIYDPGTRQHLERVGVAEGWRCLEVGGGGGSIAEWLSIRVGPSGKVVVTDIDTRFLDVIDAANLEAHRHDIVAEELPWSGFDLVHVRNLLHHLPARALALQRMVAALRPGGWLVAEEADTIGSIAAPGVDQNAADLWLSITAAMEAMLRGRGGDYHYGRRLYRDTYALGLLDMQGEARFPVKRGGSPEARFAQLTFAQVRDALVATGIVSDQDVDRMIALLDDPEYVTLGPSVIAVWGRRPPVA